MTIPPELETIAHWVGLDRVERVLSTLDQRLGSVVCVTESIRRRHNASAIIRSCEAFGVHEVQLITAGFRASKGASRSAERWLDVRHRATTAEAVADLRARGFRIYIADLAPDAYTPETVPVDAPLALLFGSELRGVSDEARAAADGVVCVPMRGLTESLNVSVSAAICLRTVAERRRAAVGPDLTPEAKDQFLRAWMAVEEQALRGMMARTAP